MGMKKFVVMSVTAEPWRYTVPAGMAARLWRWCGYAPVVLKYIEQDDHWGDVVPSRALAELESLGARIVPVPMFSAPLFMPETESDENRHRRARFDAITAARRYAAAMMFEPADYVMIGDADMLMLRADYLQINRAKRFGSWGVDFFKHSLDRWPSCYQGALSSVWREIMRPASDDIAAETIMHMVRTCPVVDDRGEKWCCETGFGVELRNWSGYPDAIQKETRGQYTYMGRLDYRHMYTPINPIDYHIRQEWVKDAAWSCLHTHAVQIPEPVWSELDAYRNECLALAKESTDDGR